MEFVNFPELSSYYMRGHSSCRICKLYTFSSFSTRISKAGDKIPVSQDDLVEEQKCVMEYECMGEQYSGGEETKKDMLEKEDIMNPSERKLCVQTQEAKVIVAENDAIEKVRFAYTH
jgi:hypothetical protein